MVGLKNKALPSFGPGFGGGQVVSGGGQEVRRSVVAGVVLELEPVAGLVRGQVLETQLLVDLPHFLLKSFHVLVPLALQLLQPGLFLPLHSDLLEVHFLRSRYDLADLLVVFSGDAAMCLAFRVLCYQAFRVICYQAFRMLCYQAFRVLCEQTL